MLLAGTDDGVVRIDQPAGSDDTPTAEQVLESGRTMRIRTFDGIDGAFAASTSGLYHTLDGTNWTDLGVPRTEVYSVVSTADGERLFAGTHPSHLYVTDAFTPDGDPPTWNECTALQELPSRDSWHTPRHRDESHVRSLCTHPDAPERLVAGIEVGGVHVSDDLGESFEERRLDASEAAYSNDVHHVLVTDPDRFVVATGGGLYRTTDAGRSYDRIDDDVDHSYFRESFATDDRLFTAAARDPPGTWGGPTGPDAALFESRDGGDTLEQRDYPGQPTEFVLAFCATRSAVFAGTSDGSLLQRTPDGWQRRTSIDATVRSLAPLAE